MKKIENKNGELFLVMKKLLKMIEYPRLVCMANRLLQLEKKKVERHQRNKADVYMHISGEQEEEKFLLDYSPSMKRILLAAIREQKKQNNSPQVLMKPQTTLNVKDIKRPVAKS